MAAVSRCSHAKQREARLLIPSIDSHSMTMRYEPRSCDCRRTWMSIYPRESIGGWSTISTQLHRTSGRWQRSNSGAQSISRMCSCSGHDGCCARYQRGALCLRCASRGPRLRPGGPRPVPPVLAWVRATAACTASMPILTKQSSTGHGGEVNLDLCRQRTLRVLLGFHPNF